MNCERATAEGSVDDALCDVSSGNEGQPVTLAHDGASAVDPSDGDLATLQSVHDAELSLWGMVGHR